MRDTVVFVMGPRINKGAKNLKLLVFSGPQHQQSRFGQYKPLKNSDFRSKYVVFFFDRSFDHSNRANLKQTNPDV